MKKIVVYDSYFGNTKLIAETIAQELECETIKVQAFNEEVINSYDLVTIGSPTRAFSPTKEIKSLVKKISRDGPRVAFFDTRVEMNDSVPKFLKFMAKRFGYANDTLEKIARRKKLKAISYSEEFFVKDTEGPLLEKEVERAREFATIIKKNLDQIKVEE
jgi:flavodoxin